MSNNKKKKTPFKGNRPASSLPPKVFFKKIGINQIGKWEDENTIQRMDREVQRRCGNDVINKVAQTYDDENPADGFDVFHSDLRLAKIWYGVVFYRLCEVAERLAELSVPEKAKILDIGGGPGHLSFWITHIWKPASVLVTDLYPDVGSKWAKEIKEHRVNFINSKLPELNEIGDETYDVIVLSRVLSFMPELDLPQKISGWTYDSYLQSKEGGEIYLKLVDIGKRLYDILAPDGRVIVVDSWSDFRARIIGEAFEKANLRINLEHFKPEKIGPDFSAIVFTESIEHFPLKNLSHSLSTVVKFPSGPPLYLGITACSIRSLFNDGKIIDRFDFEKIDKQKRGFDELIEKEGLVLHFKSTNYGIHNARIFPGICINNLLEIFDQMKKGDTKKILEPKKVILKPITEQSGLDI